MGGVKSRGRIRRSVSYHEDKIDSHTIGQKPGFTNSFPAQENLRAPEHGDNSSSRDKGRSHILAGSSDRLRSAAHGAAETDFYL